MKLNLLKKVLAFTLILLMAIPMMAIQGFAAALPADDSTSCSITATVQSDESTDVLTVTAYKLVNVKTAAVGDGKYQPQEYEYEWASSALGALGAVSTYTDVVSGHYYLKDNIDPANNTALTDAVIASMYSLIEKDLSTLGLTPIAMTKSGTNFTATGLTMGVYLVTATGGNYVYRPTVVAITPIKDDTNPGNWTINAAQTIPIKGSPVSIDKKIVKGEERLTADSAAIGDTVSFEITADYPLFPAEAVAKKFIITDTMDAGLSYAGSLTVKQGTTTITVTPEVFTDSATGITTITIDLSNVSGLVPTTTDANTKIVVTYQATLNEKAKVGTTGNLNTVKLTYSNDPYVTNSSKDTAPKVVKVYTYGIELTKEDKASDTTKLANAEFKVTKGSPAAEMKFKEVTSGSETYYVSDAASTVTTLKTGTDGKITIKGLAADTYHFTETKAPAGYVLPSQTTIDQTIVDADKDGNPDGGTNGLLKFTVKNAKGYTLPITGGIGTVMFTMVGIVLMGGGVLLIAVFLRKLRRKEA